MNSIIFNDLLMGAAVLFGLYEIGYGFYAWRLNGFKFYITAGFLIGSPFLAVGAVLLVRPGQAFQTWEILILLVWIFGVTWKAWRKRTARKEHPAEWEKWEAILNGQKGAGNPKTIERR
jgi:hypothetical protein